MVFRRRYARRSTRYRRRPTRRIPRRTTRRPATRTRRSGYRSRRALLNITSKKKQDNMAPYNQATSSLGAVTIAGNVGAIFVWCATARDRVSEVNDPTASSVRQTDLCYMRGLKENINLGTDSGASWRWRRICFDVKSTFGFVTSNETSNGWTRYLNNINGTPSASELSALLFKGTESVDWYDPFTAKVDTQRVRIHYDKMRILSSGNSTGRYFKSKHWYPMNQNLQYANDENGESEDGSIFCSESRVGMGNYYVVDFFDCIDNTTGSSGANSNLRFGPEATLYWHER